MNSGRALLGLHASIRERVDLALGRDGENLGVRWLHTYMIGNNQYHGAASERIREVGERGVGDHNDVG